MTNWIDDHKHELTEAGFTYRDIYGDGFFMGIVDLDVWNKPELQVALTGKMLVFTYVNEHGNTIQQTVHPTLWRNDNK